MFFFSEMSAVIERKSLSEVFFPGPNADDTGPSVMIAASDEGVEKIAAADCRNIGISRTCMILILAKNILREMKSLSVPLPRLVDPVEDPGDSRYVGEP